MLGPLRLLALPATERQRLRRALRVESPRAWALSVLALLACTGVAVALAARMHGPALWAGWDVSRRNVYCEEVRWDEGVRQPANTVSNAPFALTGAHMLALGVADLRARRRAGGTCGAEQSELERYALFSLANGAAQLWVAAGSLLFHGSWTRAGQRADMGAVYMVLLCPAAYVAQRLGLLGPGAAHAPFAAAVLAAGAWFTVNKWRLKSSFMVPALIALLLALQALWFVVGSPVASDNAGLRRWLCGPVQRRRPCGLAWPLLCAASLSIAAAFGCTVRDMTRIGCAPRGWLQWHAAWHLFAAAALWLLYAFFRSERPRECRDDDAQDSAHACEPRNP